MDVESESNKNILTSLKKFESILLGKEEEIEGENISTIIGIPKLGFNENKQFFYLAKANDLTKPSLFNAILQDVSEKKDPSIIDAVKTINSYCEQSEQLYNQLNSLPSPFSLNDSFIKYINLKANTVQDESFAKLKIKYNINTESSEFNTLHISGFMTEAIMKIRYTTLRQDLKELFHIVKANYEYIDTENCHYGFKEFYLFNGENYISNLFKNITFDKVPEKVDLPTYQITRFFIISKAENLRKIKVTIPKMKIDTIIEAEPNSVIELFLTKEKYLVGNDDIAINTFDTKQKKVQENPFEEMNAGSQVNNQSEDGEQIYLECIECGVLNVIDANYIEFICDNCQSPLLG